MGSFSFEGVRFAFYSDDHDPPHVHGFYAGVEIIVELTRDKAYLADRRRNVIPVNAKKSDVRYILDVAGEHLGQLLALWSKANASKRRNY